MMYGVHAVQLAGFDDLHASQLNEILQQTFCRAWLGLERHQKFSKELSRRITEGRTMRISHRLQQSIPQAGETCRGRPMGHPCYQLF